MSARAARPRSRRGRPPPPVELDPVAESSEEVEATGGSSQPSPVLPRETGSPQLLGPAAEVSGQGQGSRTELSSLEDSGGGPASAAERPQEPAVQAPQAPEADLPQGETAPTGTGPPDVFQSLQHTLSSLEAAASAWRHRPPSRPGPAEAEGRTGVLPGPTRDQEGPGSRCQQEAARLAERNGWLRLALGSRVDELLRTQRSLQALQAEKETLQREAQELQDSLTRRESSTPCHSQAGGPGSDSSSSGPEGEAWETRDSSMAHPLLRRLRSHSSSHTLGFLPVQPLSPEMHVMEARLEQLRGSMEKLKCFNRLLLAVLQGHKGRCEGLSMRLGQREAEATALRLALQYSEDCEEAYRVLLALREAPSGAGDEAPKGDLQVVEKEAWRLLAQEEAAMDGGTAQPSPGDSSTDRPAAQEAAARLRGYIQRLQERRALVKIPPAPAPTSALPLTVPHAEAMVQAILDTQPGLALPRLEKTQIQQDLLATRETLADLTLRLQLVRREKRGLELREAALRALGPAHALLLEQMRWERAQLGAGGAQSSEGRSSDDDSSGDEDWAQGPRAVPSGPGDADQVGRVWDPQKRAGELDASLARALDLRERLQALRELLDREAQEGRARRARSAELHGDLCRAHSALVSAFRAAHRKQEEQRRKLEQQVALMAARQAEELARLEAAARALETARPPPPGETLL